MTMYKFCVSVFEEAKAYYLAHNLQIRFLIWNFIEELLLGK